MARFQWIVDEVKGLEALDGLARPLAGIAGKWTSSTPVKNFLSGTWLGHQLHPMLTDVPIGTWVAAGMLDFTGGRSSARAARRLVGLGVLAALPTAAAGASDWSETYGSEQRVGLVHALGNISATSLQAASYLARRRGRHFTGVMLSTAGLGLMTGASYLGGHLSWNGGVGVNHTAFEEGTTDWTEVTSLADLEVDKPVRVMAGKVPVMLVRRGDSEVLALSATCVHAGGPLDEGELIDGCVRCPWHGSMFRLTDGKVKRGPAAIDQPAWQARVEGDKVEVRFGAG
ncbi:MAG: Rieske 2Fe-2S domain-containing protein [Acidimicrobiales bacterium]